jgi:hypothetical protein
LAPDESQPLIKLLIDEVGSDRVALIWDVVFIHVKNGAR